ncbi:hypothetical protein J7J41_00460 [bacterium]|nr:hypothetical protein [bacterium]
MASVIYVKKQDDLVKIVEKIITSPDDEVILVIPKNSVLAKSYFNFEILKRESEIAKKKIFIDSLDQIIRNFSKQAQIELIDQAFEEKKQEIADILPPQKKEEKILEEKKETESIKNKKEPRFEKIDEIWKSSVKRDSLKKEIIKSKSVKKKFYFVSSFIIIGVVSFVYLFWFKFPKTTIILYPKKTQKIIEVSLACAPIEKIDFENKILPAKLVKFERVFEKSFKTTGKKKIETFAKGKVKIYNAFSSAPQILVKNTRFLGEKSNKLFYLTKRVVVPGAKVIEGKIVPSSLEAEIIAQKPGPEFNIGSDKFWLPAFKERGSPRYYKVWAETIQEIKGGESKEISIATEKDIENATTSIEKTLTSLLETEFLEKTKNYLVPSKGYRVKIEYENQLPKPGETMNEFSVKAKALLEGFIIEKKNLEEISKKILSESFNLEKWEITSIKEDFFNPEFEEKHPMLRFEAKIKINLARKIDTDLLKKKIREEKKENLKKLLSNLDEIEKAKIIFWPFWIKKVPKNLERIFIEIK